MASKRVNLEEMEVNYKFACRCCLKSEAEFFKLDSLTDSVIGGGRESDHPAPKIPFLRLLLFCMRTENIPELPQFICVECTKSLQIAYFFIKNCLRAHEVLCRKLCPGKLKLSTRVNGQQLSETNNVDQTHTKSRNSVRHDCKVCGVTIYNQSELKQHIRMHTEESMHACKICNFVTLKHRQLVEHYRKSHGFTAAQIEQRLKMKNPVANAASTVTKAPSKRDEDDGQVKVCTLEDMEMLIPTVLTPEDFSHPQLDVDQLRDIEQQLASNSLTPHFLTVDQSKFQDPTTNQGPVVAAGGKGNLSIGAEFVVLPDGSLQQVQDGSVVFEYIDDSKVKAPAPTPTPNRTLQSLLSDSKTEVTPNAMEVDNEMLPKISVKPKVRPAPGSISALKHRCKQCPKAFPTVARLKSHQLTHNHLPKYFCDRCSYYSLRGAELIQHYKEEHNRSMTEVRSSPGKSQDRSAIFSCDMCLYDTMTSSKLRLHYNEKHLMEPTEIQLRPSWSSDSKSKFAGSSADNCSNMQGEGATPNIPLGIKYPPASVVAAAAATATSTTTTMPTFQAAPQPTATTTSTVLTSAGDLNVVVDTTSLFYAAATAATTAATALSTPMMTAETTAASTTDGSAFAIFTDPTAPDTTLAGTDSGGIYETVPVAPVTTMPENVPVSTIVGTSTTPNQNSIFGDMQDFIDGTDVAAICTIPADDMPVVDGEDIVIDNNNISLEFDADNLFEDFEDDAEVGDGEDDEEAENEDENDNNNAAADQNLLLTSDEDDLDDFDDEQSKHLQKPYCIYCNKKFTSQYKFENHMFVHRGLAPYRCELCTNLYNMKRLLIKHYKTVHKRMPTRDMVQAKGDKVLVARTSIEKLDNNIEKTPLLMCAKCPFECQYETEMCEHLNAHHGINDGVFIIRKLPYECPRCVRSFAAKHRLMRHLQRSHLVDTIVEMEGHSAEVLSSTSSTLPQMATVDINLMATEQPDATMNPAEGVGGGEGVSVDATDGAEKCDSPLSMDRKRIEDISESADRNEVIDEEVVRDTTATLAFNAAPVEVEPTQITPTFGIPSSISQTTVSETSSGTPHNFEMDFIANGDDKAGHDNVLSKTVVPHPHLINGSDQLLTSTLLESSIMDALRMYQPRTPIYICKQCNQTFDELDKLCRHKTEQHSNDTMTTRSGHQHKCSVCNTSYRTVTLLNYHMKGHESRNETVSKEILPKEVPVVSSIQKPKEDVESHKPSSKFPLICDIDGCRKTFRFRHHLKRHQTASHTHVRYICAECGCDMLTSLNLRNHVATHKSAHSYKCPKCVRVYMRRQPFRRHALREHKWDPTEDEMKKVYCVNGSPSATKKVRRKKLSRIDNDQSD